VVGGLCRLERVAAREDVHGGVPVLGPRVDREMGLGDHHHAGDPERVELVKDHVDDGGLRSLGGLHHRALHGLKAVEDLGAAVVELQQQGTTQTLQSRPPSSPATGVDHRTATPSRWRRARRRRDLFFADATRGESRLNYRAVVRQRKEKMLAFYFRASDDDDLSAGRVASTPRGDDTARWRREVSMFWKQVTKASVTAGT